MAAASSVRESAPCSPFRASEGALTFASRLGLACGDRMRLWRLVVLGVAVTWAPLLLLALLEDSAFRAEGALPFAADYAPYGRCIAALTLLLLLDPLLERRTALALQHLRRSRVVRKEDEAQISSLIDAAQRAWRNKAVHIALLLLTYAAAGASLVWNREFSVETWMWRQDAETLSLAGAWFVFVSTPVVRLLILRAWWKKLVWIWLLFRISRLRLQLSAMHPDQRCGLLFIGETQLAFCPLIAAMGVQLGCFIANAIAYEGAALTSFRWTGAAFAAVTLLMFAAPLLVFSRRIALEREQDAYAFASWSSNAAEFLSDRMLRRESAKVEESLGMPEISAMADASALYDRILATRPAPFDLRQVAIVIGCGAVAVLAPLVAFLPFADIGRRLASILL